jgi:hypothetical protein
VRSAWRIFIQTLHTKCVALKTLRPSALLSKVEAQTQATADVIRFPVERRQPPRLVPLSELEACFGYSERWWRYRIKEGMPRHKWGSRLRFNLTEVGAWLDERYGHGTEAG